MRFGLHALGIGTGADPDVIVAVARAAEYHGFSTLWAGEHVVRVDRPDAAYPYADSGTIGVPSDADWLDPLVLLGYVAAATDRIRLATGVLLLPEHHPVIVAKSVASLDVLSRGRLVLGVGIGWSSEEFAALGIPFVGRGRRTEESVEVLRTLWRDDVATFHGTTFTFDALRCYPKPVRRSVPIVFGGNSPTALRRAGRIGDGWYGFNVSRDDLPGHLELLRAARRDEAPTRAPLSCAVALTDAVPDDVPILEASGVDELVLVGSPPPAPDAAADWVAGLIHPWRPVDPT